MMLEDSEPDREESARSRSDVRPRAQAPLQLASTAGGQQLPRDRRALQNLNVWLKFHVAIFPQVKIFCVAFWGAASSRVTGIATAAHYYKT